MRLFGLVLSCALLASPAFAQTSAPAAPPQTAPAAPARPRADNRIPIFAADARGMFASFGEDTQTVTDLGITAADLKSKAFGIQGGVHVYPWRGQSMALGIGGEARLASNSQEQIDSTTLKGNGVVYNRRLRGASAQLSLNFGHTNGWSYITFGVGPQTYESYLATKTPDGVSEMALNYGAGARWYNYDHLAFTVDMRFYETQPAPATLNTGGRLRHKIFVISAGVSIK